MSFQAATENGYLKKLPRFSLPFFLCFFYLILIVAGIIMPSDGSHGLLNLKSLAFLGSVFFFALYLLGKKELKQMQLKLIVFGICSMAMLFGWLLLSLLYGETPFNSAVDQLKIFILTLVVAALSFFLYFEKLIPFQKLLKLIIYANFTYSFCKILLVVLHCLGILNMWGIIDTLGIRFMSMNIIGSLPRFQTSIDIATPFLIFFFLQSKKIAIKWPLGFSFLYFPVSFFAIFLSFSRFLLFIGIVSIILHLFTLERKKMVASFVCFAGLVCMGVAAIGVENAWQIVERRFFSADNSASDQARSQQIEALMGEYDDYQLFGKGLGAYAKNNIRDGMILHSYEVQWVAFLMQFGFFGLLILLVPLGMIVVEILAFPFTRSRVALFILYLGWLFSGFTNPFLISLTSGIMYMLFYLMGRELYEL